MAKWDDAAVVSGTSGIGEPTAISCNPPAMEILQWSSSRLHLSCLATLLIVQPEAHSKC